MSNSFRPIHLSRLSQGVTGRYQNFIVENVNESCLRMAVFTGEYPWHFHPDSDELFLVLEGELFLDFKDRENVSLKPNEALLIPAGVIHRTRAIQRTVNLCFERPDAATQFVD